MDRFQLTLEYDAIDVKRARELAALMARTAGTLQGLKDANLTILPLKKAVTYFTDIPEPGPGEAGY
jgi:hypothetical protein